jgi:Flp pilus assembly pilin Flp
MDGASASPRVICRSRIRSTACCAAPCCGQGPGRPYQARILTSSIVSVGLEVLGSRLSRDERGAALIEQALLICLITLTVLGFVIAVGGWATGVWDQILR